MQAAAEQRREDDRLAAFHQGAKSALTEIYREHYSTVDRAVGAVLYGADRETLVHEVFYRLLTRPELRASFTGGSMAAWLSAIARNLAIDHLRRKRREAPLSPALEAELAERTDRDAALDVELQQLVEIF